MWTMNFQMFNLGLEKVEEPEIKLPVAAGSLKKQESSRKTSISALLTMPNLWLCGSPQTVENNWAYQATWPASWEICMQVRKQPLELDMKQLTASKSEKGYVKAIYYHFACKMIQPVHPKGNQSWKFTGRTDAEA